MATSDTETRILEAATQCFHQLGSTKTGIDDVARVAGVSRRTVYNYFGDKPTLVFRVHLRQAEQSLARMHQAMAGHTQLVEQLAAAAREVCSLVIEDQSRYAQRLFSDAEYAMLLTFRAAFALDGTVSELVPYLDRAKDRGEVRANLDTRRAAEWIARMLFSIAGVEGGGIDTHDPADVAEFFREHVVSGLC